VSKRAKRVALAIVVLVALAAGTTLVVWSTAREAVRLSVEGGVVQLRDPLRPIRGTTRVLIVALDGVGEGDFRTGLREGRLPHVSTLLGAEGEDGVFERAYAVPDVLSILPSSTMGAWATVFTGEPPGVTGVPGNEWYAREQRRFFAPGPVSVEDHRHVIEMYTEGLLGQRLRVPTLFERLDLRAHVGLMPIARGADLLTAPSPEDVARLFGGLARGLGEEPLERAPYVALDEGAVDQVLGLLDEHGLPDVQVVYFAGVDLYTHSAEPPLHEMQRYLEDVVDPAVGRVLDAYAARGALHDTYVVFVADHGHTPVMKDERHALATDEDTDPPALVTRAGYRLRPFVLDVEQGDDDYQVVLAYHGAFASVYVADRSTCPTAGTRCDWTAPPRFAEDVLPLAQAFDRASREGALVPELRGTLDLIFVREPRPVGEAPVPFEILDGDRAVPIAEYLRRHPRPDLLRLEERLRDLATGPHGHRAGDLLLLARSGMNRPVEDRFYFSSVNHSWHGSPEAQDSRIPFVIAHPAQSGEAIRRRVGPLVGDAPSQKDVVPVLEALLRE
jgi:hypothetical protein